MAATRSCHFRHDLLFLWFGPNSRGARVAISAGVDSSWGVETTPAELANSLLSRFGAFPCPEASKGEPPRLIACGFHNRR